MPKFDFAALGAVLDQATRQVRQELDQFSTNHRAAGPKVEDLHFRETTKHVDALADVISKLPARSCGDWLVKGRALAWLDGGWIAGDLPWPDQGGQREPSGAALGIGGALEQEPA